MWKRQANKKLLCWSILCWRGFEQRIWQERLEIDHKEQVSQSKLVVVYNIQTKPWSLLLLSMLYSLLEILGTKSDCKKGDANQLFSFFGEIRHIELWRRKKRWRLSTWMPLLTWQQFLVSWQKVLCRKFGDQKIHSIDSTSLCLCNENLT